MFHGHFKMHLIYCVLSGCYWHMMLLTYDIWLFSWKTFLFSRIRTVSVISILLTNALLLTKHSTRCVAGSIFLTSAIYRIWLPLAEVSHWGKFEVDYFYRSMGWLLTDNAYIVSALWCTFIVLVIYFWDG